jgi:hypothetical protein
MGDGSIISSGAAAWWLSGGIDPANVAGVWQPKGAASLAASYLRLAGNEGYADIDPAVVGGVAPAWTAADGWMFTGTEYLKCGVFPSAEQSVFLRYSNTLSISGVSIGSSSPLFELAPYSYGTTEVWNSGAAASKPFSVSGVLAMVGKGLYFNGIFISSINVLIPKTSIYEYFLGALNNSGTANTFTRSYTRAISIYKTTLTPEQVLAVSTAMASL